MGLLCFFQKRTKTCFFKKNKKIRIKKNKETGLLLFLNGFFSTLVAFQPFL